MSCVDRAQLEHLKQLAKLDLGDLETEALEKDLTALVNYFGQLEALDTTQTTEIMSPLSPHDILRSDEPGAVFDPSDAMKLSDSSEDSFYKIPKMIL
ncbi:MAG: Asp-tRNA(Asn)/Glu-tRNA(Gln) amidotransferase subunit GatC [Deinococcaceae bacterium]